MNAGNEKAGGQFADLRLRVFAAIGLAFVAVSALWLGGHVLLVFAALAACVMLLELNSMCQNRGDITAQSGYAVVIGGSISVLSSLFGLFPLLIVLIVTIIATWLLNKRRFDWRSAAMVSVIVIASGTAFLLREAQGFWTVLWIVLCVVACDSGGYLFGRAFGGPKLFPKISPKKTWSGFLGGTFLAIIVALTFAVFQDGSYLAYVASAVLISVAALAGDLSESAAKRYYGVKDSGTIMPGHGGLMDRFDGLSLVLIVFLVISLFGSVGAMLGNG